MLNLYRVTPIAAALICWAASTTAADDRTVCSQCGSCCPTKKICRWVPEKKTVEEDKWECECEDICIPGRSEYCGKTCTKDCCGKVHVQHHWKPTCAEVRTIAKLKKVKEKKEICTWKWVVEEVCDHCACRCQHACPKGPADEAAAAQTPDAADEAPMPPAPVSHPAPGRTTSSRRGY